MVAACSGQVVRPHMIPDAPEVCHCSARKKGWFGGYGCNLAHDNNMGWCWYLVFQVKKVVLPICVGVRWWHGCFVGRKFWWLLCCTGRGIFRIIGVGCLCGSHGGVLRDVKMIWWDCKSGQWKLWCAMGTSPLYVTIYQYFRLLTWPSLTPFLILMPSIV